MEPTTFPEVIETAKPWTVQQEIPALPTPYQQQIHKTKYARWDDNTKKREEWGETVDRYIAYMKKHVVRRHGHVIEQDVWDELRFNIGKLDVLPSMRALMTAGPALERDEAAAYNCSFIAVKDTRAFDEAMYILMCGVGVGFSVERKHIQQLPTVPDELVEGKTIVVQDSKYGWATALRTLIEEAYKGKLSSWDVSKVRPAGAVLKTFGGRASGPDPLVELFKHVHETFKAAQGRKLTSVEAHGLMCKIGDIVVVGGVRRSALISLSDPDDEDMRFAKSGEWWNDNPHFALANNSAIWHDRPDRATFDEEWDALVASGSGERGFINRSAMQRKVSSVGRANADFGINPCAEIILRDRQFCNLSQITVRGDDTVESLVDKVRVATIIGTIQATLTDFTYLSDEWKKNCDEERLLGIGFTGVMDSELLNQATTETGETLELLRDVAREVNEEFSHLLGINKAAAITCVKPAGNSTQLVGAHGSGLHPAHSEYYIRTNRGNKTDPVAQTLYYQGVPAEDERFHPDTTWVFSYPMKAPEGAILRKDRTALEQLEHWKVFADHWCDHNPSVTVNVKADEWGEVGDWMYKNFDSIIGISFLPSDEHTYEQAPYQEVTREEYEALVAESPSNLNWTMLESFETDDQTEGAQELACVSGACEV